MGGIAGILIGCEAASWAPHAKNWVARNTVANIFGKSLALSGIPLQSALDAQPQGIEHLIINKNHNKLRATLFNKDTHNAATHGLDEIVAKPPNKGGVGYPSKRVVSSTFSNCLVVVLNNVYILCIYIYTYTILCN